MPLESKEPRDTASRLWNFRLPPDAYYGRRPQAPLDAHQKKRIARDFARHRETARRRLAPPSAPLDAAQIVFPEVV